MYEEIDCVRLKDGRKAVILMKFNEEKFYVELVDHPSTAEIDEACIVVNIKDIDKKIEN